MDQPPPMLAVKGESAVFKLPAVAIVGARNASLAGIKMARMLAADFGRDRLCDHLRPRARHRHGRA
jgi:DNA processing protein